MELNLVWQPKWYPRSGRRWWAGCVVPARVWWRDWAEFIQAADTSDQVPAPTHVRRRT